MPSKKANSEPKVVVRASSEMLAQDLRKHIMVRHVQPRLGFWARGEHDAAHRLFGELMDHTHTDMIEDEDEPAGEGADRKPQSRPRGRGGNAAPASGRGSGSRKPGSVPRVQEEQVEDQEEDE